MSLLLISLPPGAPGSYAFATSTDGQTVAGHGSAAPALLPAAARGVEVVAMVPAAQLSWHRVELPRGAGPGSPRLRAVLVGLLEDQLLDDAEALHFAIDPDASAGGPAWVAACDKAWLTAHLQALDAAQRPVARIVPELHPRAGAPQLGVVGEPDRAMVLMSGDAVPGGAQALPLGPGTLALLAGIQPTEDDDEIGIEAEPAVAELAEHTLGRRVRIVPAAQRLLAASRTRWELAQLDLARTGRARAAKRAGALWRDFVHAPLWRPARWGVALLLLAHLAGLNLWAWRTQQELQARRVQIRQTLTETFPQVQVVVDAPLQMGREVAALRQATGAASARDLEPMLVALGQATPAGAAPTTIEFTAGELRAKGVELPASQLTDTNQRLRPLGYQLQTEADTLVLRREATP